MNDSSRRSDPGGTGAQCAPAHGCPPNASSALLADVPDMPESRFLASTDGFAAVAPRDGVALSRTSCIRLDDDGSVTM